jgi:catechol 2,3-dioxygenase-like lactoylglutathione lyase family enzyme
LGGLGGRGGAGGDGGAGGVGGTGGRGSLLLGLGGDGGKGGAAGIAGSGGLMGTPGSGGAGGSAGLLGKRGQDGATGSVITFTVGGVGHAGVLVSDVDESLRLFRDALGLEVIVDIRNAVQTASGLSGVDRQIMNVVFLKGEDGAELEIHQYVDPAATPAPPMDHHQIGSSHFMLKVTGIEGVVARVEELGYTMMTPIVEVPQLPGFKYAYFRGPDGMMVELQEGSYLPGSQVDL